jgi:hypothetical protein
MRAARIVVMVGCCLAWTLVGHAASYSHARVVPNSTTAVNPSGACGTVLLTQSAAQNIVPGNSVNCNSDGTVHVENSYYRAYNLSAFPAGFNVCAIEFGIQSAVSTSGFQPVTLRVYSNSGAAFPAGTATLIATSTVALADQSGSVVAVPMTAPIAANTQLVVEVFTPDGQAAGNSFFIGSNAAGESAPSFLRAPNCGVITPATTEASGFGNMQIVLNALGNSADGAPIAAANPEVADFGWVELGMPERRTVMLSNLGTAALTIAEITSPTPPFLVVQDACTGQTLAPTDVCFVEYSFTPLQTDPVSTSLSVISNASPVSIDLRGAGILPYPLPGLGRWGLLLLLGMILLLCRSQLRNFASR